MKRSALAALLSIVAAVTVTTSARAQEEEEEEEPRRLPVRVGYWLNGGGGWGSLGCSGCPERANGFSGTFVVGTSMAESFLVGVGIAGFTRTDDPIVRTVVTLDMRFRFYFTPSHNLFVTVGAGVSSISGDVFLNRSGERGTGGVIGLGYDLRLTGKTYITPYVMLFGAKTENLDANIAHAGLSITLY